MLSRAADVYFVNLSLIWVFLLYVVSEKTKQREVKGIAACAKEFGLKEGLVITEDYEAEEKIDNKKIKFIPLWKWLLEG